VSELVCCRVCEAREESPRNWLRHAVTGTRVCWSCYNNLSMNGEARCRICGVSEGNPGDWLQDMDTGAWVCRDCYEKLRSAPHDHAQRAIDGQGCLGLLETRGEDGSEAVSAHWA
jgi:hypothetical protein